MSLTQEQKQEIINKYQIHGTDTGSSPIQIALLTERINRLSEHLKNNKKDFASRRGLMKLIGKRKGLLDYLRRKNPQQHQQLIQQLGIRG
ncbi:MAG: 30S ribosomal protein S15 [Geminocystis sp.]|nr:30S ribosomal protein S15 [Geminocystis sp.]HIK38615.1 30S ribosomal protein S15 [Geminocystis sp. M7585_C2015_104]MCS7147679.1 30S ribosomal protein S15 [Geminocystis sp.]MCX8078478.1 30S ribosomal protein S15 [Geminocystis sp.]MDW8117234.1 30S ribosomal protein S15 [Geminocystis sp.]